MEQIRSPLQRIRATVTTAWHTLLRRPRPASPIPPDMADAAIALARAQRAFVGMYPTANRICLIPVASTGADIPAPMQSGFSFAVSEVFLARNLEIPPGTQLVAYADDGTGDSATLALILQRAFAALEPGGWCCIDVINETVAKLNGANELWPAGTGAACTAAALRTRCLRIGFEITHTFGLGYVARSIDRDTIIPAELVKDAGVFVDPERCARLAYICHKPVDALG